MKSLLHAILVLILVSIVSCNPSGRKQVEKTPDKQGELSTGILIADPIIYEALIKNPDPEDSWGDEELKNFNRKKMVNLIFKAVYQGKATAYNYHTDKPMSIEEVKELEDTDEFDRSKIGKIQFVEDWYFNPETLHMTKIVKSVVMAYEVMNQFGELRGYKTTFRIDLN